MAVGTQPVSQQTEALQDAAAGMKAAAQDHQCPQCRRKLSRGWCRSCGLRWQAPKARGEARAKALASLAAAVAKGTP